MWPYRRNNWLGSIVLLAISALAILRPNPADLRSLIERVGQPSPDRAGATQGRGNSRARGERALVLRAIDGDTIEVRIGGRREDVRYIGVDTPETVKPGTPVQCFGPQASAFDHRLVDRRQVRLRFDAERRDAYGRLLAYVYVGGRFVNAALVRRGLARTLTIPPNDHFAALFQRLEMRAARRGRGLWGACPP